MRRNNQSSHQCKWRMLNFNWKCSNRLKCVAVVDVRSVIPSSRSTTQQAKPTIIWMKWKAKLCNSNIVNCIAFYWLPHTFIWNRITTTTTTKTFIHIWLAHTQPHTQKQNSSSTFPVSLEMVLSTLTLLSSSSSKNKSISRDGKISFQDNISDNKLLATESHRLPWFPSPPCHYVWVCVWCCGV